MATWGEGGYPKNVWVGVSCWYSETLTLNQTKFSCILQPYTRLKTKNPYPIPDTIFQKLRHHHSLAKTNILQQLKHIFIF